MRRISSKTTFWYKRVFPAIWVGFLLVFIGISLFGAGSRGNLFTAAPFVIVPLAMMGFGFFFMKKLVLDLADEVWDDGDALVVKNSGQEQRIALADIKNVNYSAMMSPPRVVLSLRRPTIFGEEIAFCAPPRLVPFSTSPVIGDLIERVETGPAAGPVDKVVAKQPQASGIKRCAASRARHHNRR